VCTGRALPAGWGALALVVLLYPTGRLPSKRWRPVAWALAAWTLVATVLLTVQPTLVMAEDVSNPVGLRGSAATMVEQALAVAILPFLVLLPAAVASLIVRFRRARGRERQQLKWLLYAVALSAAVTILNTLGVLGAWGGAIDNLVAFGIPIAIGIALLHYRLYDIDAHQPDPGLRLANRHPRPGLCRRGDRLGPAARPRHNSGRRRGHPRDSCGVPAVASWIGASTGAAMTPPGPSRPSPLAFAMRSTWTP
jgi:DMSO/TMAO reductase YedYZ heme-binding membrane subunit